MIGAWLQSLMGRPPTAARRKLVIVAFNLAPSLQRAPGLQGGGTFSGSGTSHSRPALGRADPCGGAFRGARNRTSTRYGECHHR
jgi:hypothetical protein